VDPSESEELEAPAYLGRSFTEGPPAVGEFRRGTVGLTVTLFFLAAIGTLTMLNRQDWVAFAVLAILTLAMAVLTGLSIRHEVRRVRSVDAPHNLHR
jgi:cell division protein FtsW (lipid II flippase)